MENEVMTIQGLADYLKLAPVTLYKMVKEGKVPCRRIGKSLRFPKTMIDQWLDRQSATPPKIPAEVEKALNKFAETVKGRLENRVKDVRIYGSWARGEARVDSDIDLAVIVDRKDVSITRSVSKIAAEISLDAGKLLSVVILEAGDHERGIRESYPLHVNIDREGRSL